MGTPIFVVAQFAFPYNSQAQSDTEHGGIQYKKLCESQMTKLYPSKQAQHHM